MLAPLTPATAQALLSPSARVLVASALPAPVDVSALPWADVHWPTLVSLMAYERAETAVYRLMRRVPADVPEAVRSVAQGLERVASFRAAELSDAAACAADALREAGVPALWLKGAALAMQSAEGFGVRGMGDLDLLVTEADRERARVALAGAGWSMPPTAGYDGHHHDAPMVRAGGLRLELHTSLWPSHHPFADEPAEAWIGRGRDVVWGARRVLVLPPAWHVVYTAVHWAWNHEGTVGSWQFLHDMQRLTAGWPLEGEEWESVIRHASALRARLPVGWGVWSAARLAGLPVSERIVHRLRGRPRLLDGTVERQWVLAAFHSPAGSPSVWWSRFWWRRAMQSLGDGDRRWPWSAGRAGESSRTAADAAADVGPGVAQRWARWRRHLGRMLGS